MFLSFLLPRDMPESGATDLFAICVKAKLNEVVFNGKGWNAQKNNFLTQNGIVWFL